jgi:hypothetical protein
MQNVESFRYYTNNRGFIIEFTLTKDRCTQSSWFVNCKWLWRWNGNNFEAYNPEEPEKADINAAEIALMQRWEPGAGIPLLEKIASYPDYSGGARILYMLGLAYELEGSNTRAVQAYWKCWSSYPESIYARLAQAKLELK